MKFSMTDQYSLRISNKAFHSSETFASLFPHDIINMMESGVDPMTCVSFRIISKDFLRHSPHNEKYRVDTLPHWNSNSRAIRTSGYSG